MSTHEKSLGLIDRLVDRQGGVPQSTTRHAVPNNKDERNYEKCVNSSETSVTRSPGLASALVGSLPSAADLCADTLSRNRPERHVNAYTSRGESRR